MKRIQKKIKNHTRKKFKTHTIHDITCCIELTARRFNCSESWVIATALSDFFGVEIETYDFTLPAKTKLRRIK